MNIVVVCQMSSGRSEDGNSGGRSRSAPPRSRRLLSSLSWRSSGADSLEEGRGRGSSGDSGVFLESGRTAGPRLLLLGPARAGKTSLAARLAGREPPPAPQPTLHSMLPVVLPAPPRHATQVILEDTGSHFTTEFPAMAALSIQHCTAALLVFSLADPGSLQEVS